MKAKALFAFLLPLALGCKDRTLPAGDSSGAHAVAAAAPVRREVAAAVPRPTLAAADSLLLLYLARVVERDGFSVKDFAGMHSYAKPCIEEEYGDVLSSYWLARGRILGYISERDTLRARLELLTVAEQLPDTVSAYSSVVKARLRTDTLLLKLVPDSSGRAWQTCGYLSNGHSLGGYGLPANTRYEPSSSTRAKLLGQVDSIRQASLR